MAADARDTPTENRVSLALVLRDLGYIKEKIDRICTSDKEQDDRLSNVERLTWAGGSLVGLMAAIFIPIAISAIKKWFGL